VKLASGRSWILYIAQSHFRPGPITAASCARGCRLAGDAAARLRQSGSIHLLFPIRFV